MAQLTAFGKAVRILRIQTNTTLKVMADSIGVSSPYLSAIETGAKALNERVVQGAIDFFSAYRVDLEEIKQAANQTTKTCDLSSMEEEDREVVAAFARFTSANGEKNSALLSEGAKARLRRFLEEQ